MGLNYKRGPLSNSSTRRGERETVQPELSRELVRVAHAGFTLIEMLVVIAIISILVAIIFPVFGAVMENSREQNSMANLQKISSGLALYKLDNHYYPPVLFGYAMLKDSTNPAAGYVPMSAEAGQPNASQYLVGLYPQYVPDWHSFTSADNPNDDGTQAVTVNINAFPAATAPDPRALAASAPAPAFYVSDAFDISPQLTGINQISKTVFVPRYQTSWTSYPCANPSSTPPCTQPSPYYPAKTGTQDPDYSRQLRWELPPSNTYVTSTTYHVGNANKVLVLFESGTVKKVNVLDQTWNAISPWTNYGAQEANYIDGEGDISATTANNAAGRPDANAQFWRYSGGQ